MRWTASLNEEQPKKKFMPRSRRENNSLPNMVEQDFGETFLLEKSGGGGLIRPNR
jgi:hypothetical protein